MWKNKWKMYFENWIELTEFYTLIAYTFWYFLSIFVYILVGFRLNNFHCLLCYVVELSILGGPSSPVTHLIQFQVLLHSYHPLSSSSSSVSLSCKHFSCHNFYTSTLVHCFQKSWLLDSSVFTEIRSPCLSYSSPIKGFN